LEDTVNINEAGQRIQSVLPSIKAMLDIMEPREVADACNLHAARFDSIAPILVPTEYNDHISSNGPDQDKALIAALEAAATMKEELVEYFRLCSTITART